MANSVTIRTTAPGAKEAAGQLGMLKAQVLGMGSAKAGPLGGMASGFGGAGLAMLGAVGAGVAIGSVLTNVGEQLGNAANAAIADQKSVLSLTQALETNVPAWDGNLDAINKVTDAAIDLGFADDDSRASIQKLVIATGDITKSLYLYSIAQDVARGTGKDLGTATDIVMKANIGNSRALKQMGIDLGKAATSTELLGALQERYAGQAETYADSTAGSIDVVNEKFGEAQETIGYGVLPLIDQAIDYFDNLATAGQGAATGISEGFKNLTGQNGPAAVVKDMVTSLRNPQEFTGAGKAALDSYMAGLEERAKLVPRVVGDHVTQPTLAELARFREEAGREAGRAGVTITDDLAGAISGNKDVVAGAMDKVKEALKHPMAETAELARIAGALTSTQLANGMNSTNPYVRSVARQQQQILLDQWQQITGSAYSYGRDAAQRYASGLGSVGFHVRDPFKDPGRDPGHKGPGGYAGGGDMAGGEVAWVGENGRELIRAPGGGAHVYSNSQSKGMMGGGGIAVTVNLSTREFNSRSKHYATTQAGAGGFR